MSEFLSFCLPVILVLLLTGCSGGADGGPEDGAVPLTEELAELEEMSACAIDVTDEETGEYLAQYDRYTFLRAISARESSRPRAASGMETASDCGAIRTGEDDSREELTLRANGDGYLIEAFLNVK